MPKSVNVTIETKIKWWTIPLIKCVANACVFVGVYPSENWQERIGKFVAKYGVVYKCR